MNHKLSVITPSFNQGRFIERTIESVLSQQFSGSMEYLVMDGGSKDETVEILGRYGSPLTWISEKDDGQAHAVNKGLARSTGDILGWLNSDDIYYPGAIAAVCDAFDADPSLDVVYGEANHIDEDDRVIEPYPTEDPDLSRLINTCYICQPAVFMRKSVVERFGPLDAKLQYCMDYEYWVRLTAGGAKFARLHRLVAGSRLYSQNKTLGSRVKVHAEINDMLRHTTGLVPDRWLFNYAHILLEEGGVPRSDGVRFPLFVAFLSIYNALKWNHRVSLPMAKMASQWAGVSAREFSKRMVGAR